MIWPITKRTIDGAVVLIRPSDPPPMPKVRAAVVYLPDAIRALERGLEAWNATQLRDAIRSAQHFLDAASVAMEVERAAAQEAAEQKDGTA